MTCRAAAPPFRAAMAMFIAPLVLTLLVEVMPTSDAAETRRAPALTVPRRGSASAPRTIPREKGSTDQALIPRYLDPNDLMWLNPKTVTEHTPRGMMRSFGLMQLIQETSAIRAQGPLPQAVSSQPSNRSQVDGGCRNPLDKHPVYVGCMSNPGSCLRMDLRGQGVCGTIPATIMEDIPGLEELDVTGRPCDEPKLVGTIPDMIGPGLGGGRTPSIKRLRFGGNQLTGTIPPLVDSVLEELEADCNCLTGTIPDALPDDGNLRPPLIRSLDVSNNDLSGGLPPLPPTLRSINAGNNRIRGAIPDSIGAATNLEFLTLTNNLFEGSIPSVVGLLTKLKALDLDINQLSDALPSELGELVSMSRLNMTLNQIAGSLPTFLGNFTKLTHLFLSDNLITGPIVDDIEFATGLVSLVLGNNALTGSIPDFIADLPFLKNLNLKGNKLTGWLPDGAMSALAELTYLDLCCGGVSGPIPSQMGTLTNLEYLLLDNNTLSGTIPSEMGSLSKLKLLYMPYAGLSGTIPTDLARLTDLQWLSLAGQSVKMIDGSGDFVDSAGLIGRIPSEVGAFTNMRDFDVGIHNYLSGWLPTEMGLMTTLEYMWVDYNEISGSLPSELGRLTGLRGLFLEGNMEMCGGLPPGLPDVAQPTDPDWISRHYRNEEDEGCRCAEPGWGVEECSNETLVPTLSPTVFVAETSSAPTPLPEIDAYTFTPYVPNTDEIFANKPSEWFGKMLLRYLGTKLVIPGSLPVYVFNIYTSGAYMDMRACEFDYPEYASGCVEISASSCPGGSITQSPSPVCWNQPVCYDDDSAVQNPTLAACVCQSAEACDCFLCGVDDICCGNICIQPFDLCLTACGE